MHRCSFSLLLTRLTALMLFCMVTVCASSWAFEMDVSKLERLASTRFGAKGSSNFRNWVATLDRVQGLPEREQLTAINQFWNRSLASAEDIQVWGQADYWATPLESLGKGAGDCEDYVIGKYFSLIRNGISGEKLRFIYVRARMGGVNSSESIAHMVLGYYATPSAVPLVLDSLISEIVPANERPDLTPIFSFNAQGVYVKGSNAAPVDRLGRWRDLLARMEREGFTP